VSLWSKKERGKGWKNPLGGRKESTALSLVRVENEVCPSLSLEPRRLSEDSILTWSRSCVEYLHSTHGDGG